MGKIDKFLGKWASRKLTAVIIGIVMSFCGKLNDNLTMLLIAYITIQGLVDATTFVKEYFKK